MAITTSTADAAHVEVEISEFDEDITSPALVINDLGNGQRFIIEGDIESFVEAVNNAVNGVEGCECGMADKGAPGHEDNDIYIKAALALWGLEMSTPQSAWSLTNEEMQALHDRLVADGQIDPEPEGWIALDDTEEN